MCFESLFFQIYPLQLAIPVQKFWAKFSTLCHGLLAGIALGQCVYVLSNLNDNVHHFLISYSYYSQTYVCLFYFLCVICIISVLDRYDLAHLGSEGFSELLRCKRCSVVIVLYIVCLCVHVAMVSMDQEFSGFQNPPSPNSTSWDMKNSKHTTWNILNTVRSVLAILSWIIVSLVAEENNFYIHLKSMEKFLPTDR